MERLIRISHTSKGKPKMVDNHEFVYYHNNHTNKVDYWLCAKSGCKSRLTTRRSTGNLASTIPTHDHGNNLLKRKVESIEEATLKRMLPTSSVTPRLVMTNITNKVLEEAPNGLPSISSAGALKSKLWRAKNKLNPMPKLPHTHKDIMDIDFPEKLRTTKDGQDFLTLQSWVDENELSSILVFLSTPGAEILKRAPVWLMDGTFKTAPEPYKQVK